MKNDLQKVELKKLSFHPSNESIYGKENVHMLISSIREFGLLEPLVVNKKMQVVSGNKRLKALLQLEWGKVDVAIREFESDEEELAYLLEANASRDKSFLQRVNEGLLIERLVQTESKARMLATLNHGGKNETPLVRENFIKLEEASEAVKGRTHEIVAKKVGLSNYKAYAKGRFVALQILKFHKEEATSKAVLLTDLLQSSLDAAVIVVRNEILDKEDFKEVKALKKRAVEIRKAEEAKRASNEFTEAVDKDELKKELYSKVDQFEKLASEIVSLDRQIDWDKMIPPLTDQHRKLLYVFTTSQKVVKGTAKQKSHV
ncbi:MAG: ParB N-terminal domain-containing protein [Reichenbachiella sp.]|uniref:ParB N-terminal domain-containing protein n=1 Tax=Reichenbachiella sp. TaxID=2184521 RepID=UPI0029676643|nr:ParB N-terminal domain-containing protein [Reichenbachiella sp.]MDW3208922.1 ParB N-terminal domain-containing protein [Reichenbachiella sp.]